MLDTFNIILIVSFFLISILIGYFSSRNENSEGFFIANRKLGLFQSVMTISGSFVGAMTLLVYTAFVFVYGISAIWMFVGFIIGFILFSMFAVKLKEYSKGKKFYTLADYLKSKFDRRTSIIMIFVLFVWYFGTLSAQFIGGGKVLNQLTGMSFSFSAIIMCLVILIYLILGGFKSVVKTDVFQFLMLGFVLTLIVFTIKSGISVPVEYFNLFNAGIVNIIAFLFLGILTPFAVQDYYQRIFAMKNKKIVKKSFLISIGIVTIISFFLTYIGLVARTNFVGIDADTAVLFAFTKLVPPVLIGLVTILFFSAILSSADTFLFVISMNFTNDFLGSRLKTSKQKVLATRIAIFVIGVLALILALLVPNIVDITIIFKAIGLIISPIIFIIWLFGGDKKVIKYTIFTLGFLILLIASFGYIKPELTIIGSVGGFFVYGFYKLLFKILKRFK